MKEAEGDEDKKSHFEVADDAPRWMKVETKRKSARENLAKNFDEKESEHVEGVGDLQGLEVYDVVEECA